MWIVLLSFGISLSFGQTPEPTQPPIHPTFRDDGKLSFDGDEGWAISIKGTPNKDECQTTSNCVSQYNGNPFYGPFSDKYFIQRNVECGVHSIVTVAYNVLSCGVDGNKKDKTQPIIMVGIEGGYTTIKTETASGQPLCSSTGSIADWLTETVPQHIEHEFTSNPVNDGERFEVKIQAFVDGAAFYIYDIEIKCSPTGQAPTPQPTLNSVSGSGASTHNEYCISGFDDTARNQYNGEYIIRTDELGLEEIIQLKVNNEATEAFEKNDHRGDAFLFEKYDATLGFQWVIASVLPPDNVSPDAANIVFECPASSQASQTHLGVNQICTGETAKDGDTITITSGECVGVHVTIEHSPFSILSIDLSVEQIKTIAMLAILSFFSCILGMVTCRCCQLICYRTNKNYKKVNHKDIDDVDF